MKEQIARCKYLSAWQAPYAGVLQRWSFLWEGLHKGLENVNAGLVAASIGEVGLYRAVVVVMRVVEVRVHCV